MSRADGPAKIGSRTDVDPDEVSAHAPEEDENADELVGEEIEDPYGLTPGEWDDEDESDDDDE